MRVGHFLTQWGPEIIQLTEGMIKGTDGRMYKSRRMPEKIDVCGPTYCDLPSVIVHYPCTFQLRKITEDNWISGQTVGDFRELLYTTA